MTDYSCFGRGWRVPVHAVGSGALRHGDQQRQAAATGERSNSSDATAITVGEGTGYGLGWRVEDVVLAGKQTRSAGYEGRVTGRSACRSSRFLTVGSRWPSSRT
jgi:hypothetical protein